MSITRISTANYDLNDKDTPTEFTTSKAHAPPVPVTHNTIHSTNSKLRRRSNLEKLRRSDHRIFLGDRLSPRRLVVVAAIVPI